MAESTNLRLALAQIDPTVGDIEGNSRLISESIDQARDRGAQLVLLPELCLSGYPPEDLVLRTDFLDAVREALDALAAEVVGTVALVGFPERLQRTAAELEDYDPLIDPPPPPAYNSLAVLAGGEVSAIYRKCDLPNYGVFDERRYFEPGTEPALIEVDGALVGLTVCEDIWHAGSPEEDEVAAGGRLVVNSSASPYHRGKGRAREAMVAERASANGAAFALCNMVGGQDELVFDGASVVVGADGQTLARAAQFAPELLVCDLMLPAGSSWTVLPLRGACRFWLSSPRARSRRATSRGGWPTPSRTRSPRSTRRSPRACGTTSRRTGSSTSSSPSRAGSTPRWSR